MGELQFAKTFLTTVDSKSTKYQADHVFDPQTFGTRIPYTLPKLSSPPHPAPPKSGPTSAPAPGSTSASPSLTVVLKSTRNPAISLTLPNLPPSTQIADLKAQVHSHLGGASVVSLEKIKILSNKKPIPPSKKTIAEVLDGVQTFKEVELGVMVMGGAPDPPPSASTTLFAGSTQAAASGPGSENAAAEAATAAAAAADAKTPTPALDHEPMEGLEEAKSPPAAHLGEASGRESLAEDFWTDLQGFLEQRLRDQDEAVRLRGLFQNAWSSSQAKP